MASKEATRAALKAIARDARKAGATDDESERGRLLISIGLMPAESEEEEEEEMANEGD